MKFQPGARAGARVVSFPFVQVPREAADKLIFEEEAKEKAKKEAKIAEEKAEREKAKKGKVFAHLGGGGGSASAAAKPPTPPSSSAKTAAAAAGGVEERWVPRGMVYSMGGRGGRRSRGGYALAVFGWRATSCSRNPVDNCRQK